MKVSGNHKLDSISPGGELAKKLVCVIFVLLVYRLGTYIPLPGVSLLILDDVVNEHQSKTIIGMVNVLTGGALGRMSIFALNIMPYISASVIVQLVTILYKEFGDLQKSGEAGRQKINQYSKYLCIILSLFQGYGIAMNIELINYKGVPLISDPGAYFRIMTTLTLMSGTLVVVWLADQINVYGIGNGSSIIIFSGIVSGLLPALLSLLQMGRDNIITTQLVFLCGFSALMIVIFVTFIEKSSRKLLVQYPRKQIGNKIYVGNSTYLPIKINVSGVMPPIFANALLLFPTIISAFYPSSRIVGWRRFIESNLSQGKPLYMFLYISLIIMFCFLYNTTVLNPEETAENLKKSGAVIIGRRPGDQTVKYLQYILRRLTAIGALYIGTVCAVPEIIAHKYNLSFYLGGTSILIVINVILEFASQIQSHLLNSKYTHLMHKANMTRRK